MTGLTMLTGLARMTGNALTGLVGNALAGAAGLAGMTGNALAGVMGNALARVMGNALAGVTGLAGMTGNALAGLVAILGAVAHFRHGRVMVRLFPVVVAGLPAPWLCG